MFINLSNHAVGTWGEDQIAAARRYGEIIDLGFPKIPPHASSEAVDDLVSAFLRKINVLLSQKGDPKNMVMVEGEFVFTYRCVSRLKAEGIPAVAAVTPRMATEEKNPDGTVKKVSKFKFEGFREY